MLLGGVLIHGIFPGGDSFEKNPDVAGTIVNATSSIGSYFFTGAVNLFQTSTLVALTGYSFRMGLRSRRDTTKDDAVAKEEATS